MSEWTGQALVLGQRRHGAGAAIITLHAPGKGKFAGMIYGGRSPSQRATWITGNLVEVYFETRKDDQIGKLSGDAISNPSSDLIGKSGPTAALASACAIMKAVTGNGIPAPALHTSLLQLLLRDLHNAQWAIHYVRWELRLLEELGYAPEDMQTQLLMNRVDTPLSTVAIQATLDYTGDLLSRYAVEDRHGRLPTLRQALRKIIAGPRNQNTKEPICSEI